MTERSPRAVYLAPQKTALPFEQRGEVCEVIVPEVRHHQMVVFDA